MAVDYFLKIDGIRGDSADSKHKAEIDVISFSWGVTQHEGKPRVTDFKIVKTIDQASPLLLQSAVECTSPGSAMFVARKAGERGQEYLKIAMREVVVTSVAPTSGAEVPLETVTLGFRSAEMQVASLKPDGTLGPFVSGVVAPSSGCGGGGSGTGTGR